MVQLYPCTQAHLHKNVMYILLVIVDNLDVCMHDMLTIKIIIEEGNCKFVINRGAEKAVISFSCRPSSSGSIFQVYISRCFIKAVYSFLIDNPTAQ